MSDELGVLEAIEKALKSKESPERSELDAFVVDLARLPEQKSRLAIEQLAKDIGIQAVPLLEVAALAAAGDIAETATELLALIKDKKAASALARISNTATSNNVRKKARRGLHSLASRGIHPEREAQAIREPRKARANLAVALTSPIDGLGNRAIWLAFGEGADVEFLGLVLDEETGIVEAISSEMARSRFDREAEMKRRDEEFPWVDLPVDYCRYLIEEAHRNNSVSGTPLPLEYLAWRDRIGRPERKYERPLVYAVINAAEVRWNPTYLDHSGELMEQRLFQTWLIEQDKLEPYIREREVARQSGLVLAGFDRAAREKMIEDRAIQALFDEKRRTRLKRRLEEMAYHLWKLDRSYQAKMAIAAALAMEPPDSSLVNHPFIRSFIEWSLDVAGAMATEERYEGNRLGARIFLPY